MDELLDMLEDILLQDDKVNLSMDELHCSLDTINDVIRLGHILKQSILNIITSNHIDKLLENEIYYNTVYKSKLIDNDSSNVNAFKANVNAFKTNKKAIVQIPLIEKIGGYPTLKRGEKWPIVNGEHLTFITQFKFPNGQDNILYRVFANIDDNITNYVLLPLVIKETNNYLKNIKLSYPNGKLIKEYIIQEWITCKELKQFNDVCDIYKNIECNTFNEQVFEYSYDLILNAKKEIIEDEIIEDEIQLGISICDKTIDEKKVLFTISAELIQKNILHDGKTYYFYEDESMQLL
jgi:hypothetical protein